MDASSTTLSAEPVNLMVLSQPIQSLLFGKTNRPYFRLSVAGERVPWTTSAEWCEFFHLLFSSEPSHIKQATAIKDVWATRGLGIRAAVYDLTCNLRRLLATSHYNDSDKCELAFQVIRFVSLITDQVAGHRDRDETTRSSMKQTLKFYDITEDIITLRHTITHNTERTSISECVSCCSSIINWLTRVYWANEHNVHKSILNESVCSPGMCGLGSRETDPIDYKKLEDEVEKYACLFDEGSTGSLNEIATRLQTFAAYSTAQCALLCRILVSDRFMLPVRADWELFFTAHQIEMQAKRQKTSWTYFLPKATLSKWAPLVAKVFATNENCLDQLVLSFCCLATEKQVTDHIMLSSIEWVRFIMQQLQRTNAGEEAKRPAKKRKLTKAALSKEQHTWDRAASSFEVKWPTYYERLRKHTNINAIRLAEDLKLLYLPHDEGVTRQSGGCTDKSGKHGQQEMTGAWQAVSTQSAAARHLGDFSESGDGEVQYGDADVRLPQLGRCAFQPLMQLHSLLSIE